MESRNPKPSGTERANDDDKGPGMYGTGLFLDLAVRVRRGRTMGILLLCCTRGLGDACALCLEGEKRSREGEGKREAREDPLE